MHHYISSSPFNQTKLDIQIASDPKCKSLIYRPIVWEKVQMKGLLHQVIKRKAPFSGAWLLLLENRYWVKLISKLTLGQDNLALPHWLVQLSQKGKLRLINWL